MSDALTDIRRDEGRAELLKRIRRLEREFLAGPSAEKARELARLWAAYARMPRGYWGGPNRSLACERVARFHEWRPGDGLEWLACYHDGGAAAVRTGEGFVVDDRVFEDLFERAVLEQGQGPFSHSVFRVRARMEVERLTCRSCPRFDDLCGAVLCRSRVDAELAERRALAERGEALLGREAP